MNDSSYMKYMSEKTTTTKSNQWINVEIKPQENQRTR